MADENIGSVKISEEVVAGIASVAACEVEGVIKLASKSISSAKDIISNFKQDAKGVSVEIIGNAVNFTLNIVVAKGIKIQPVAKEVQLAVKEAVENMTGFTVKTVNVLVVGIAEAKNDKADSSED